MKIRFTALLFLALFASVAIGQDKKQTITFDKTIYDFGDIAMKGGPVTCTFEFTNTGTQPILIQHVSASCGCTTPGWTKEPVAPGGRGFVKATYAPQGIMPFTKTLTVNSDGQPSTVMLQIRGKVVERIPTIEESYPIVYGLLRAKSNQLSLSRMVQGSVKKDSIEVVNTGAEPLILSFSGVPSNMKIEAPDKLAPSQKGFIRYSYSAGINKEWKYPVASVKYKKLEWGAIKHPITILINGKKPTPDATLTLTAVVEDNFSNIDQATAPVFFSTKYTNSFGALKKDESATAEYEIVNNGKSDLKIYRAYEASGNVKITAPSVLKPGEKASVKVVLTTKKEQAGDKVYTIMLTTNAPNQASANLLLTGKIE